MTSPLISVSDAAALLGVTPGRVRVLIRRGALAAKRFCHAWLIDSNSLATYRPRPVGRPRKQDRENIAIARIRARMERAYEAKQKAEIRARPERP